MIGRGRGGDDSSSLVTKKLHARIQAALFGSKPAFKAPPDGYLKGLLKGPPPKPDVTKLTFRGTTLIVEITAYGKTADHEYDIGQATRGNAESTAKSVTGLLGVRDSQDVVTCCSALERFANGQPKSVSFSADGSKSAKLKVEEA